jgi:hypothetical protein
MGVLKEIYPRLEVNRFTHKYPLKYVIQWALFVVVVLILFWAVLASAQKQVDVVGCRQVNYPEVCVASYDKCNNIDLDDACLAVAQLDGQLGYDAISGRQIPTSQNIKTGDKPVERVHN